MRTSEKITKQELCVEGSLSLMQTGTVLATIYINLMHGDMNLMLGLSVRVYVQAVQLLDPRRVSLTLVDFLSLVLAPLVKSGLEQSS